MDFAAIGWDEVALRLFGAAGFASILGVEREVDGQDAGFRTHILLALGAGLFGLISVGAFDRFMAERATTNVAVDVTRVASYVAAGIGFIGGGAIIKQGGAVKGITTAASLWVAAAVGLASGLGFWRGAVVASVVALVALAVLQPIKRLLQRFGPAKRSSLVIGLRPDSDVGAVLSILDRVGGRIRRFDLGLPDGSREAKVEYWSQEPEWLARTLEALNERPDVLWVQMDPGRSAAASKPPPD